MALPKPCAKIWIDPDKKKLMLSAPYNSNFNQLIKNYPRFFDKEKKIWEFDIEYVDQIVEICERVFIDVIRPPYVLLEIFEFLSPDDLKDMYECIRKRHSSDKTLMALSDKFFGDYIDLAEVLRRKKRLIRPAPAEEIGNAGHPGRVSDILSDLRNYVRERESVSPQDVTIPSSRGSSGYDGYRGSSGSDGYRGDTEDDISIAAISRVRTPSEASQERRDSGSDTEDDEWIP
ncbi:hypothetical protein A2Z67_05170 [Candidatus Woesebacteria bacterium RBG_13_36_22]|uniref:Uncharacterized protein n=1 Tax=Candidatus Woesebacteria bacterium RBG_13_36_22 TaxID=1802478 RepID=A0A1F7X345_9BACT|nr:MAG: hypothetical protein A2Z67_05170 [Candidatus Woesebacteria bacterium RBG_13_36_22]